MEEVKDESSSSENKNKSAEETSDLKSTTQFPGILRLRNTFFEKISMENDKRLWGKKILGILNDSKKDDNKALDEQVALAAKKAETEKAIKTKEDVKTVETEKTVDPPKTKMPLEIKKDTKTVEAVKSEADVKTKEEPKEPDKFSIENVEVNDKPLPEYKCLDEGFDKNNKIRYYVFSKIFTIQNDLFLTEFGFPKIPTLRSNIVIAILEQEKCAYAINKGYGWTFLYSHSDYKFQSKMPQQILDEEGVQMTKVFPILGEIYSIETKTKGKINLSDLEIGDVCNSFKGRLSKESMENFFPNHKTTIDVEFLIGMIKINKSLNKLEYFVILTKLEKEYKKALNSKEVKCTGLTKLMVQADWKEYVEIYIELLKALEKLIANDDLDNPVIESLNVCPKKYYEIQSNEKITIFPGKIDLDIDSLNLSNILNKLKIQGIKTNFNLEYLHKVSLKYKILDETEKLMTTLRGTFYSQIEKTTYFCANGFIYFLRNEFLSNVQNKFVEILKTHFLSHSEQSALQLAWEENITEHNYCLLYTKKEHNGEYLIGDRVIVNRIELFDILYAPQSQNVKNSYLYHVKNIQNSGSIAYVCSQLLHSAHYIQNYTLTQQSNDEEIIKKYEKGDAMTKNRFEKTIDSKITKENFLEMAGIVGQAKRNPVFVLALKINQNLHKQISEDEVSFETNDYKKRQEKRSLQYEKNFESEIHFKKFEKRIESDKKTFAKSFSCSEQTVTATLLKKLMENGFISKISDDTYQVKSKLALDPSLDEIKKLFPNSKEKCGNLLKLALRPHRTYFKSLSFKMEVIRLVQDFTKFYKSSENLKICEIISAPAKVSEKSEERPSTSKIMNADLKVKETPSTSTNVNLNPSINKISSILNKEMPSTSTKVKSALKEKEHKT